MAGMRIVAPKSWPKKRRPVAALRLDIWIGISFQRTLPPFVVHSLSVAVSLHPSPLHEFCPLHELCAVLQALVPLQEFPPLHFTLAPADALAARLPTANRSAAEATRTRCMVIWNSLG